MSVTRQGSSPDGPQPRSRWTARGRALGIGLGLVIATLLIGTVLSLVPFLLAGTSVAGLIAVVILSEAGYASCRVDIRPKVGY